MPISKFDYSLDSKNLDLRKHLELYRTGIGEQGVLLAELYKANASWVSGIDEGNR